MYITLMLKEVKITRDISMVVSRLFLEHGSWSCSIHKLQNRGAQKITQMIPNL